MRFNGGGETAENLETGLAVSKNSRVHSCGIPGSMFHNSLIARAAAAKYLKTWIHQVTARRKFIAAANEQGEGKVTSKILLLVVAAIL